MNIFSPEQVAKLWKRQFGPWDKETPFFHPYTCANRDTGHLNFGGDTGMLIPTVRGWICPCCDYTQTTCASFDKV